MLIGSASFALMTTFVYSLGRVGCDWQVIALVRTGLATVFAAVLVWSSGARFVFWKPRLLWLRSLTGSVSLACNFFAMTRLPVADVLTLTNTFPIWVALLSWPLEGRRPRRDAWLAIAVGIAGVALVQRPHLATGNIATLVALFSALTTAVALLGLHHLRNVDPRAVVVHFSAVSCLTSCLWLAALGTHNRLAELTTPRLLAMFLGLGATGTLGQIMLTKAFAAGPPARVSVVGLSQVCFGLLLDVALFDRRVDAWSLAGIALVLAPTAWLLLHRTAQAAEEPIEGL